MSPMGHDLLYSTYMGGNRDDEGRAIAVDSASNAYITGMSSSTGASSFPVANAFKATLDGPDDAIVAKIGDTGGATSPASANLIADNLEVTQTIQDLSNSIRLVAGKRTFIR